MDKKVEFYCEYSSGLNDWQRRAMEGSALRVHALHRAMDIIASAMYRGEAERINAQHYRVTPQLYGYLRAEGILDMISIVIEVKK